jgi:hypothetical protein
MRTFGSGMFRDRWKKAVAVVAETVEDVVAAVTAPDPVDDWPRSASNDCIACGGRSNAGAPAHAPGEGCGAHERTKAIQREYAAHVAAFGAFFPGDRLSAPPEGGRRDLPPLWHR